MSKPLDSPWGSVIPPVAQKLESPTCILYNQYCTSIVYYATRKHYNPLLLNVIKTLAVMHVSFKSLLIASELFP